MSFKIHLPELVQWPCSIIMGLRNVGEHTDVHEPYMFLLQERIMRLAHPVRLLKKEDSNKLVNFNKKQRNTSI